MTWRKEMVSGSRKQANQHDPEEKKRFLGQGSRRVSMTRRRKKIFGSRKEPDCHDPEEKKDFWVKEAGKPA